MPDKKPQSDCGCGFGKKIPAKYSLKSGRKSPPVSATLYSVGTIKRGLDNNKWVIVKTSNGVKRWKKTKFGKKPANKKLYARAVKHVKSKVKAWPSAYASGQVVQRYKRLGGTYRFGNDDDKFYEKGASHSTFLSPRIKKCLDVIYTGKNLTRFGSQHGGLTRWFKEKWVNVCNDNKPCSKSGKKYPYCRPSVRVTSKTPKTIHEISKKKLKMLCKQKRNSKRIFV